MVMVVVGAAAGVPVGWNKDENERFEKQIT